MLQFEIFVLAPNKLFGTGGHMGILTANRFGQLGTFGIGRGGTGPDGFDQSNSVGKAQLACHINSLFQCAHKVYLPSFSILHPSSAIFWDKMQAG